MARRIVMTTLGSLGDLHPYMALALGLRARGHEVAIASTEYYRPKVEAAGREAYEDVNAALRGADLVVTAELAYGARLLAERLGLRWVSTSLAPMAYWSAYDPPLIPPLTGLARRRLIGPFYNRLLLAIGRRMTRSWSEPVRQLRADVGLPPTRVDPIYEGVHSPYCSLALFSPLFGPPQRDWTKQARIAGFLFYDRDDTATGLSEEIQRFLSAGPPPVVFTLGSAAVYNAGSFYAESVEAARLLGRRAILLVGRDAHNHVASPLPSGVAAFPYAPYSELFPRAAAIVHQGGIGTTAQALRAGRPMLVMPFSFDQPDNGARVERMGVARVISRARYRATSVASELRALLEKGAYAARADQVGRAIRAEDGLTLACDAIDEQLELVAPRGARTAT